MSKKISRSAFGPSVSTSGLCPTDNGLATIDLTLPLFAEIDEPNSRVRHNERTDKVEIVLRKKELGAEYWPRLLKDQGKLAWLTADWDKWADEDEQTELPMGKFHAPLPVLRISFGNGINIEVEI